MTSSEGIVIPNYLVELIVLVGEVSPFTVVFQALDVLWSEFHLGELLWEVLGAVLVVELWLVRGSLLLLVYRVPVYAFEPRVCHDILSIIRSRTKPGLWIFVE